MALHYRTQGIILQKREQGESDRIFEVCTKDFGKIELWAISARKITSKLRGGLELFYLSELEFIQGRKKKIVIDALALQRFPNTRRDLKKLFIAYRIGDAIHVLVQGEESDKEVWMIVKNTFEVLESFPAQTLSYHLFYFLFVQDILSVLGYRPSPEHCAQCRNEFRDTLEFFAGKSVKDSEAASVTRDTEKILSLLSHHYLSQFSHAH